MTTTYYGWTSKLLREILRFGCTIGDRSKVSTSSDGWQGYALDVLDAGAFQRYWDAVVEPLIADAGPLAGRALKYLHTDSWEVEPLNWTPTFRAEFRKRRGYDLLPYLPALAGRIVESRPVSEVIIPTPARDTLALVPGSPRMAYFDAQSASLDRREYRAMLGLREQAPHHRLDLRARERDSSGLGHGVV